MDHQTKCKTHRKCSISSTFKNFSIPTINHPPKSKSLPSLLLYPSPKVPLPVYVVPLTTTTSGHLDRLGPLTYAVPFRSEITRLLLNPCDPPPTFPHPAVPLANHCPPPHTSPNIPSAANHFASASPGGRVFGSVTKLAPTGRASP